MVRSPNHPTALSETFAMPRFRTDSVDFYLLKRRLFPVGRFEGW